MHWKQGLKLVIVVIIPLVSACTSMAQREIEAPVQPELILMTKNCAVGCPSGGSARTLDRAAYTLNNNGTTKFANWVAYTITKTTSANGRARDWQADPDIPADETLAPEDFAGANAALKVDRGHQANLASMGGTPDWEALNYLSNITPQKANLNQGPWARLEEKERNLSKVSSIGSVSVITGPLYEHFVGTLPGTQKPHKIPSGYWKIIFVGSTPENGLYASFVMDQETPHGADYCHYQVGINEIESRSGLKVWRGLPEAVQASLKSKTGSLTAKLGC